ncbi:MAG: CHAT domain-containing protein [Leptolyngbyaceae cyanobacterium CRU_2_3]|nr:CHAT domain-containing protein [Leptolyngbyaceae cyanobacterium CRU_2_3]
MNVGSETRKRAFIAMLQDTTNAAIALHLQLAPTNPEAAELALTTVLRRKGRVLEAVTDTFQRLRQNLSSQDQPLLTELQAKQSQLAALIYGGIGGRSPDGYRAQVTELRSQIEILENTLSQRSAEFRVETQSVTVEAIAQQIPVNTVLIEWVQYQPLNFQTQPQNQLQNQWDEPRYAAYLLDADGTIQWVDLGKAAAIDELINQYRDALRRQNFRIEGIARQLDAQIMQPIRSRLGNAQHLLLSPDGQLNLIPFAALVDENEHYLIETYTLTYSTSGRDLLRQQLDSPSRQSPVLIANPDYDTPGNPTPQVAIAPPGTITRSGDAAQPLANQRSTDLSTQRFAPLPGTAAEANAIFPLLPHATLLTGSQATENNLKQLQGPSILHIATHGFFFRNVEFVPPPDALTQGFSTLPTAMGAQMRQTSQGINNENPLLRSGLALAGFNPRHSGTEDGVLTALEASGLDLRGTQLVVLSACDTGLGEVVNGEGVYGLRRAFLMAGAESLVMSLWKVDDYATSELMARYYQRLQQGEGRSEAFRQVQLEMLQTSEYQHPYFWAAFIFSGDWQRLNGG